jgi:Zn-dependent peptidase ImmA (M78 family)
MSADASAWAARIRQRQGWSVEGSPRIGELTELCASFNCVVESKTIPGEAGRTFYDGTTWHIWIEEEAGFRRSRFTLCHEIGHLLLRAYETTVEAEEKWCDAFAAEMLLPANDVAKFCTGDGLSGLALVSAVAEQFGVTRSVALLRLNHLRRTNLATLTFRRIRQRWILYSTMCLSSRLRYALRSIAGTSAALSGIANNSMCDGHMLPLSVLDKPVELSVSVARSGNFITVAVDRDELRALTSDVRPADPEKG